MVNWLANNMTENLSGDFMFVDLMKIIRNSAIEFQKEYEKKLVVSRIVDIVKYMTVSAFQAGRRTQPYSWYTF